MALNRRYRLLCPVARALDRLGDRWSLLILRDLHAGPARFSDLRTGLTGIASNLLTSRLQQLLEDGLIEKRNAEHGVTLYSLTALGRKSQEVIFEMARFGSLFAPDIPQQKPGNLRTIVATLGVACNRAVEPDMAFVAELLVDGQHFTLSVGDSRAVMHMGATKIDQGPDIRLVTSYDAMMASFDELISAEQFLADHASLEVMTAGKEKEFFRLLQSAQNLLKSL